MSWKDFVLSKILHLQVVWQHRQPVGNLPGVLEQCFEQCYEPILRAIEQQPTLRFNFYYSGPLLQFLEKKYPDYLARLGVLIREERIEILAGGFYDPILAELSEKDRQGQIRMSRQWWKDRFEIEPAGLSLAPGVWDPSLASSFHRAGIRYTILNHERFMQAGVSEANLFGHYMTEHEGKALAVLPNNPTGLRLMPYGSLDELFAFYRRLANRGESLALTVSDHAERWGVWQNSHDKVIASGYFSQWLERLRISSDWVKTSTISEHLKRFCAKGKCYPPAGVNWEMGAWSLAPETRNAFFRARSSLAARHDSAQFLPFFQAGSFAGFRMRYAEGNQMYGKSLLLDELRAERAADNHEIQELLWKAQCNTAYWYATSGGIYLSHLREEVWSNLTQAEEKLREKQKGWSIQKFDLNSDGIDDVVASHPNLSFCLDLQYGGACVELSLLDKHINLANTLTRRTEALADAQLDANSRVAWGLENAKPEVEDWYRRHLFQDHFIARGVTVADLESMRFVEMGDFVNQPFGLVESQASSGSAKMVLEREGGVYRNGQKQEVTLRRSLTWSKNGRQLTVGYEIWNRSVLPLEGIFASEVNLMISSDLLNPDQFEIATQERPLTQAFQESQLSELKLNCPSKNMQLRFILGQPAEFWTFPLLSRHQSEGEVQTLRQGNSLWFGWHEKIPAGGKSERNLILEITEKLPEKDFSLPDLPQPPKSLLK